MYFAPLLLLLLPATGAALIVAFIALRRSADVQELQRRLRTLERDVRNLRERQAEPVEPASAPDEVYDAIPVAPPPEQPRPRPRPAPKAKRGDRNLEGVIGRQVLGWAAVVLMLFAVGFFIKYAFDNDWIGPVGQIATGALIGSGLCVGGLATHRRKRPLFAQMLTAGGIAILYLSVFGTFGFYDLLPRERASVYLASVVALSAASAVLYNARGIAIMALAGGLLSPMLLATPRDQYVSLFIYLAVLNAGVLAMSHARNWRFLAPIALFGTQCLFWTWGESSYHPEKQSAALIFQAVLFALHLTHNTLLPAVQRRSAHWLLLGGDVLNAFLFAATTGVLLADEPTALLAAMAVGMAILYALVTIFVQARSSDDARLSLTTISISLAFLATAIALRGEAGWVALGWAVQGLALWWFGLRVSSIPMRVLGGVLLSLALGRYLVADAPWQARYLDWPVLNSDAMPGLAIAVCLVGAGWLAGKFPHLGETDQVFRAIGSLSGVLLLWLVLSLEVYHGASTRWPDQSESFSQGLHRAQASLSVFWAIFAAAIMTAGFWRRLLPLRVLALCLFGLTTAKVILIDMAGLPGIYRVAAFFVLAVVLGGAAYAYQRFEAAWKIPSEDLAHADN